MIDYTVVFWTVLVAYVLIFTASGHVIGEAKGRAEMGALLGFFLGIFGVILIGFWPDDLPKCSECLGGYIRGAKRCRNCGSEIG